VVGAESKANLYMGVPAATTVVVTK